MDFRLLSIYYFKHSLCFYSFEVGIECTSFDNETASPLLEINTESHTYILCFLHTNEALLNKSNCVLLKIRTVQCFPNSPSLGNINNHFNSLVDTEIHSKLYEAWKGSIKKKLHTFLL